MCRDLTSLSLVTAVTADSRIWDPKSPGAGDLQLSPQNFFNVITFASEA